MLFMGNKEQRYKAAAQKIGTFFIVVYLAQNPLIW